MRAVPSEAGSGVSVVAAAAVEVVYMERPGVSRSSPSPAPLAVGSTEGWWGRSEALRSPEPCGDLGSESVRMASVRLCPRGQPRSRPGLLCWRNTSLAGCTRGDWRVGGCPWVPLRGGFGWCQGVCRRPAVPRSELRSHKHLLRGGTAFAEAREAVCEILCVLERLPRTRGHPGKPRAGDHSGRAGRRGPGQLGQGLDGGGRHGLREVQVRLGLCMPVGRWAPGSRP